MGPWEPLGTGRNVGIKLLAVIFYHFINFWNFKLLSLGILQFSVITARQRSFGKVMFSQACIILSEGRGRVSLVPCPFWRGGGSPSGRG